MRARLDHKDETGEREQPQSQLRAFAHLPCHNLGLLSLVIPVLATLLAVCGSHYRYQVSFDNINGGAPVSLATF